MLSKQNHKSLGYIVALVVVLIWGSSYVCSKVLVSYGLDPYVIYCGRALMSYICLVFLSHSSFFSQSWKDELLFLSLGLSGGSVYYVLENTSLIYSTASNVSFIICSTPMVSSFLAVLFLKDVKAKPQLFAGAFIAVAGLAVVEFYGKSFSMHWLGDVLAVAACFSWAIYTLLIRGLSSKYDVFFINRKVFFYGLITVSPFALCNLNLDQIQSLPFSHVFCWVYLALISSCACFLAWTYVVKTIGVLKASNLIYFNPVATMFFAYFIINEPLSISTVLGSCLILFGVMLAAKGNTEQM